MTEEIKEKKELKPPYRLSRRERRKKYHTVYNNNRLPKGNGFLNMGVAWDGRAIYFPKRKKLKGYQKN